MFEFLLFLLCVCAVMITIPLVFTLLGFFWKQFAIFFVLCLLVWGWFDHQQKRTYTVQPVAIAAPAPKPTPVQSEDEWFRDPPRMKYNRYGDPYFPTEPEPTPKPEPTPEPERIIERPTEPQISSGDWQLRPKLTMPPLAEPLYVNPKIMPEAPNIPRGIIIEPTPAPTVPAKPKTKPETLYTNN